MFLGPLAGGFVCAVNFKRMGQKKKARMTLISSSLITVLFVFLNDFVLPENMTLFRILYFGILIAGYVTFSNLQENDFENWAKANHGSTPSNGWSSIGWGLLGFAILVIIVTVLAAFIPSV